MIKTLAEVEREFLKGLEEIGVTGFAYGISDPDSECIVWGRGNDAFWQDGALRWLVRVNELPVPKDDEDDGDGERWKDK